MPATDIAVIGFAQTPSVRDDARSEVQLLVPTVAEAIEMSGVDRREIGFTCAGSCDYLTGGPFAFVQNLEAAGAWPPIAESHVEADGAWALYEAWVRLQEGDIDTALVFGSGKSSPANPLELWPQQLDPYYLAPLGVDPASLAGIQARALLESGKATERDFAEVVARSRRAARSNPNAQLKGDVDADALLAEPYFSSPLRRHDLPPITDGAAAVVLARGDKARQLCSRPAWIRGLDHRVDPHQPGMRDLTTAPSATLAARKAGYDGGPVDVAELCAVFSPQEIILREAIGLPEATEINPSGGPLAGNPVMAAGLIRIIEAAARIIDGSANRAVAHATGGQLLQQNLVCLLEGE
ncbi:MAG TPA: thiolase domain-containing protein [Acidimicrobiales bacterium]|nr:thiolase domain-containing protein [Acidimicrobiales bacterium]